MAPEGVLPERVSDALSPLPPGYADLLRSVVHLLSARTEVRAVWVAGFRWAGKRPTRAATSTWS